MTVFYKLYIKRNFSSTS